MDKLYYCTWDYPVLHPERFPRWSHDVRKLIEYFPHYIASERKQKFRIVDVTTIQEYTFVPYKDMPLYDPRKYRKTRSWLAPKEGSFVLLPIGPTGTEPISVVGPGEMKEPITTENAVAFRVKDGQQDHPELFHLRLEELLTGSDEEHPGELVWHTRWSLHDILVIASLTRLKHYFPEISINTNFLQAEDMQDGIFLCKRVFGRGKNPII